MSKDEVVFKLKKFGGLLRNSGINVEMMYLFGSYAKGTAKSYSDIDVCVVSKDLSDDMVGEMVRLGKFSDRIDDSIEVHPMRLDDFGEKYNGLAAEVKKYGMRII